ncbi:MAG: hypothetical protein ABGX16_23295 [Pirellulales bacterium]
MTRTITLAPLSILIALAFTATLQAADRPPNIVYIMADDTEVCKSVIRLSTPSNEPLTSARNGSSKFADDRFCLTLSSALRTCGAHVPTASTHQLPTRSLALMSNSFVVATG